MTAYAVLGPLRSTFASRLTRPLSWRRAQLRQLVRLLREGEDELLAALEADLGKPAIEAWGTDLAVSAAHVEVMIRDLDRWAAPQKVAVPLQFKPARARVVWEPLGVTLVIAPWNYPVQLLVVPMAAALAAGNCVVGKPSELAPATSAALARLVPRFLDERAVALVEGGVHETTELLAERWDHIFYTGNARVARVVMKAAAEHLTPVTLELGGKSPAVVDRDADLGSAARRIAWGKFINAGQSCVAPDHVLVHQSVHEELVERVIAATRSFYGPDPSTSPDYARIVNDRHFQRVAALVDGGGYERLAMGGERDPTTRYFAPTVLDNVEDDAPAMAEEIFGPVLPVRPVADVDEAISLVNAGDKPLAVYAFTRSDEVAERIQERTSSGGLCLNHVVFQIAVPGLPFGGVGGSGIGAYHGRWGFETFSHAKAVLAKPRRPDPGVFYPPYRRWKQRVIRRVL